MTSAVRVIALEYHDVVARDDFDASGFPGLAAASYKLTAEMFERHVAALAASTERLARMTRAFPPIAGGEPAILLTFDDGGVSAIERIAPTLEAQGVRGAFFVTTDRIDTAGFLTSAQIRELHRRGHIIGSHSCSHPTRMAACSASDLAREWNDSIARLSAIVGETVITASVPGGYYSRAVGASAAAAGVRVLFTSEPTTRVEHSGACLIIGRYTLRRDDAPEHVTALVADASAARRVQWLKWNAKKVAKAMGGRAYLRLREVVFKNS